MPLIEQISLFFSQLFSIEGFPARWFCGEWTPFHGWLYIISNWLIWSAYFSIPVILLFFIRKRRDVPFIKIFALFALFIFACGTTHLVDSILFWYPVYRFSALVLLFTGIVSWVTIFAMIQILPQALSLRSIKDLEKLVKERSQELSDSENQLKAILDNMADSAVTVDEKGVILGFNKAASKLFGYEIHEVMGKKMTMLMPKSDYTDSDEGLETYLRTGATSKAGESREVFRRKKNGEIFPAELAVSEVMVKNRKMYTGIVRDITTRKKNEQKILDMNNTLENRVKERTAELEAEISLRKKTERDLVQRAAQLQVVNKELESFCYSVSHDLRAPLRAIVGFSQAVRELYDDELDERGIDYLTRIHEGGRQMDRLIDALLQLSRLTREDMNIRDNVDLSKMAQEIMDSLTEAEPDRKVIIKIEPDLKVTGDENLLMVMMQNLLLNAWKYSSQKNEAVIEFSASVEDDKTVLVVRDNGAGFDMAYIDKLFSPFQRLHTQEEFEGLGIGLATVSRVINRHGGSIWAESEEGNGAAFYFTLEKELGDD